MTRGRHDLVGRGQGRALWYVPNPHCLSSTYLPTLPTVCLKSHDTGVTRLLLVGKPSASHCRGVMGEQCNLMARPIALNFCPLALPEVEANLRTDLLMFRGPWNPAKFQNQILCSTDYRSTGGPRRDGHVRHEGAITL